MAIAPADNLFTVIARALADSDYNEAYLTAIERTRFVIAGLESAEVNRVISQAAEVAQTPYPMDVLWKHYLACDALGEGAPADLRDDSQAVVMAGNIPIQFAVKRTSVIGSLRVLFTKLDPMLFEADKLAKESEREKPSIADVHGKRSPKALLTCRREVRCRPRGAAVRSPRARSCRHPGRCWPCAG